MNRIDKKLRKEKAKTVGIIHVILFHTYAVFFGAVILGVIFDQIFAVHIFDNYNLQNLGFIMIVLGSILVYWAQSTTNSPKGELNKERDINFFLRGPYKYTRNPTNLGLTIMTVGLGIIINSFFSVLFIVITYLISRFIFIRKQDSILTERYGEVFMDYKKKVKDWL